MTPKKKTTYQIFPSSFWKAKRAKKNYLVCDIYQSKFQNTVVPRFTSDGNCGLIAFEYNSMGNKDLRNDTYTVSQGATLYV